MFSLYKIDKKLIYKRNINSQLKVLTNRGDDLRNFGSAMLDGLNNDEQPIQHAYVIREGVCGRIVAWAACIKDYKNQSGHVFVLPHFRGQGLAKRALNEMLKDYPDIVFYPISLEGYNLFKSVSPESVVYDTYIKNLILS